MEDFLGIGLIMVALALLSTLFIKTIPQHQQWALEYNGQYKRTLLPGRRFIWPGVERVGKKISTEEKHLKLPSHEAMSQDKVWMDIEASVDFRVVSAQHASYHVANVVALLESLSLQTLRDVVSQHALDSLLLDRTSLQTLWHTRLQHAMDTYGLQIVRVEVRHIVLSEDILKALALPLIAQRTHRANAITASDPKETKDQHPPLKG